MIWYSLFRFRERDARLLGREVVGCNGKGQEGDLDFVCVVVWYHILLCRPPPVFCEKRRPRPGPPPLLRCAVAPGRWPKHRLGPHVVGECRARAYGATIVLYCIVRLLYCIVLYCIAQRIAHATTTSHEPARHGCQSVSAVWPGHDARGSCGVSGLDCGGPQSVEYELRQPWCRVTVC